MQDEFNRPPCEDNEPKEFTSTSKEFDYIVKPKKKEEKKASLNTKLKKVYLVTATVSCVSIASAATGQDVFNMSSSPSSPSSPSVIVTTSPSSTTSPSGPIEPISTQEVADVAFPSLGNLEPNGIPSIASERLNEDYVLHLGTGEDNKWEYVYRNPAILETYGQTNAEVDGLTYNRATNTLTLTNFKGGIIECNLLGNSFKIELVGHNEIMGLKVWGYYYGGSVTITGTGSLTITDLDNFGESMPLIWLNAEVSESVLMIDETIEYLDITSSYGGYPIYVNDSLLEKNIYYKGLYLHGGKRYYMKDTHGYDGYMVEDSTSSIRHIRFDHTKE